MSKTRLFALLALAALALLALRSGEGGKATEDESSGRHVIENNAATEGDS